MASRSITRSLPTHFTLPSGDKIPSVALGVFLSKPGEVGEAVKTALKVGYRHIDGAWAYGNEKEVGQAIKESGVPRKDLWLTSKLWNNYHEPQEVERMLDESLASLQTDYLDLYLIHWPVALKKDSKTEVIHELTADAYPTWKKLEEMVDKGKIRNLGLSNFPISRIERLMSHPLKYKPAVNQIEIHYFNPQPHFLKWAKERNILIQAWSPIGGAGNVKENLEVPVVQEIAKELGMTPAQVYISWHVQRGTNVLPKSVSPARVEENFKVAALPDDLFQKLEKASQAHSRRVTFNPSGFWDLGYDVFGEWPY